MTGVLLHGAKATVYLNYKNDLDSLCNLLSAGLNIPEIYIDTDPEPPHKAFGYSEALGFEIWVEKVENIPDFHFSIKIETTISLEESFNDQMYDLSPWLSRYISTILKMGTLVLNI